MLNKIGDQGGEKCVFLVFEKFANFFVKRRLLGQAKEILSNFMMVEI